LTQILILQKNINIRYNKKARRNEKKIK